MKKWFIPISVAVVIMGSLMYGVLFLLNTMKQKEETASMNPLHLDGRATVTVSLNDKSSQSAIIQMMHDMTHQKVRSYPKWGAVEMSAENIEKVHTVVSRSDFEYKETLLALLTKWKNGDFRNVDDDHNDLWGLQNGNLGKATGIMSAEDEAAFVQKYFR